MKAIKKGLFLKCNRCGNTDRTLFGRAKCSCKNGVYCRNCVAIGKLTCCMDLEESNLVFLNQEAKIHLNYELTSLQKKASNFLLNNYLEQKDCLLIAVCGAGKTEMIYSVLVKAINEGKKVCVAIPRVEVVKEISERMRDDLNINISSLYGGTKDNNKASLFVSTCNQLMKHRNTFDLIILDEADAFPYTTSSSLQYAVKNSLKKNGLLFKMTATPTLKDKLLISRKFRIRSRFHRKKIVVPKILKTIDQFMMIDKVIKSELPTICYVPSIKYLEMCREKYGDSYFYISSKTEERTELLNKFKKGETNLIFATTILERGLTFKGLNVLVVEADNRVFSLSSLVQISGRVGRKAEFTEGFVTFSCKEFRFKLILCRMKIIFDNLVSKIVGDLD